MTARTLLLTVFLTFCAGSLRAADDKKADPPKPPTQEQIKAWLKKLEEPTRSTRDPKQGPPDNGVGPDFDFRIHGEAIFLARAGEPARKDVFALLNNPNKSSQARAHAAIVLVEWLKGKGAKQELDEKVLEALKEGLQGKDLAVKWVILDRSQRYGKRGRIDGLKPRTVAQFEAEYKYEFSSTYFSDAAMEGLLHEVIGLLGDDEPRISGAAADVITSFGRPKQGIKELIAALDQREVWPRAAIVYALAVVGQDDPAALKAVLGQLKPERYAGGAYQFVIIAVGQFGPKAKDAVPALIEAIKSSEFRPHARMELYDAAFLSLGEIGPDAKVAVPVMLKYLEVWGSDRHVAALDKISSEAGKEGRAIQKRALEKLYPPKKS